MADSLEDVKVGHYRSLDSPKNFAIRVKLRRVTAASFLPEFQIGSQQGDNNAQEGAEVAGEALEMQARAMGGANQSQGSGAKDSDSEELRFHWQQKVFCQREVELYEDPNNCFGPLEQSYHAEIMKLRSKGDIPSKRLFSYVDSDRFTNLDEETRTLTTSPSDTPTYLVEKVLSVRRRNVGSKLERRNLPGGFVGRSNPVTVHQSEIAKTTAHVVSTPYKTMYIMADLAPEGRASTLEDEYLLCSIKIDANGQIFVKPDFSRDDMPYRVETGNDLTDVYEYTLEHCSEKMTSEQKENELKSFNELYNRHALYLASQLGTDFTTLPEPGVLRVHLFGEIVSAKGFDNDGLYVHFFMELPQNWRSDDSPFLSGVTQNCATKAEDKEDVAHFGYPFEFSLVYEALDDSDAFVKWPTLFVEVLSLDSWERHRTEGYGYVRLPSKPGSHKLVVDTWRPLGNGVIPEMKRFFIGGSPELEDPTYPLQPVGADDKVLSKYFFRTASSGSVTIRVHVVQQCQVFMEKKKANRHTRTLLDRLGGVSALDSLSQVMDAFQRARKRMLAAREGLPPTT